MSAEVLRRAAALMRERATARAVPEGVWFVEDDGDEFNVLCPDPSALRFPFDVVRGVPYDVDTSPLAEHIASWHPAVALAVAGWLDHTAAQVEAGWAGVPAEEHQSHALAVAYAYLSEEAA